MKYKRLPNAELKELEKEFIHYLSSAQITAQDWEKMKANQPEHAEELIEIFSDMVYDKVLSKITYLEHRDEKTLSIFYCQKDKISLAGIVVKEASSMNLLNPDVFKHWSAEDALNVNVIKSEKKYDKERESEIFELIENGCFVTDDYLYTILINL